MLLYPDLFLEPSGQMDTALLFLAGGAPFLGAIAFLEDMVYVQLTNTPHAKVIQNPLKIGAVPKYGLSHTPQYWGASKLKQFF